MQLYDRRIEKNTQQALKQVKVELSCEFSYINIENIRNAPDTAM
jgi:hypothetical protein